VLCAVTAPAALWRAYVDPRPSTALLTAVTVGSFALVVGIALTLAIRRAVRRRRVRNATASLLALHHRVLLGALVRERHGPLEF
jgi:hypothetical protein